MKSNAFFPPFIIINSRVHKQSLPVCWKNWRIFSNQENLQDYWVHWKWHGNYVHSNKLYEHFRKPGHSHCNMKIFVLEQCFGDENILKAREDYWIQRCNTVHKGLNTAAKLWPTRFEVHVHQKNIFPNFVVSHEVGITFRIRNSRDI